MEMTMSPGEEPKQHTVKKVLDDDAASALMALASTAEKKGSEDHGEEEVADVPTQPSAVCTSPAQPRSPTVSTKFPSKLMSVLNDPANAHVVTWSADGKSFIFLDRKGFESTVLPIAFKDSKFESFLRKLYRWGFSKCQTHSKSGLPAYKHELFHRDFPIHCKTIECKSKGRAQIPSMMMAQQNALHGAYLPHASMAQSSQGKGSGMPFPGQNSYMGPPPGHYNMYDGQSPAGPAGSFQDYFKGHRDQHNRVMNYMNPPSLPDGRNSNSNMQMNSYPPMGMYPHPMNAMGMYMHNMPPAPYQEGMMGNGYMMGRDTGFQGGQPLSSSIEKGPEKQQNDQSQISHV